MNLIKTLLSHLYKFWVFLVFTVFMLLFLPGLTIPFMLGNRFSWIGYKFLWLWSLIFSWLTFIRYEFVGREHLRDGRSFIYVCNHTSFLDLPGLTIMIGKEYRPLAKKELLKIPVFGWIALGAAVIVDRSSGESKKKSMNILKETLAHGISILLFAEGTQNRTKELLQPFKDGAFRIAMDTQTPILPMVIIGAGKLMPPGTINLKPGKVKMIVGNRIEVDPNEPIADLKQRTFDIMKQMMMDHLPSNHAS
jgi:1-acyl-sn-glycerol-3-phosphate acyltransferase